MPSVERRFVSQLGHNEQVSQVFLASEKQLRPNRNGNLYLQVDLSDRSGAVNARLWNATENDYKAFDNGDFVFVEGATQLFQGNMQLIANRIRKARPDEVFEGDFITLQSADIDKMRNRLVDIMNGVQSPPLARLAKNHHAYKGGLLEHVLSLMELILVVAPKYPQLSQDKLLMGALLHDAAKVEELGYERDICYTDAGQLLGHMVIGVTMLDDKVRSIVQQDGQPFPERLLIELKHMIISHHGEYEYGSSKLPMTLEAIALHMLDNLDAKVASFTQLMADCPNADSNWTQYFTQIGRKLFKPEKV
jgi:3'-5' exoribonuclease